MSTKPQCDLFLLLTIIGSFLCMALMFLAGMFLLEERREIFAEIARGDMEALLSHLKQFGLLPFAGGFVFVGTFFAYRRYQKLLATKKP
jgi:hypothetical protein